MDYPNLSNYLRELYQVPGVAETVNMDHIKRHYFMSMLQLNPSGIVPLGPALDFEAPHDRAVLVGFRLAAAPLATLSRFAGEGKTECAAHADAPLPLSPLLSGERVARPKAEPGEGLFQRRSVSLPARRSYFADTSLFQNLNTRNPSLAR